MFGQNAGDVIIDNHHFVHFAEPLLGKHADRGGTAPYAHTVFQHAIHDWRLVCLNCDFRALINFQVNALSVAQIQQRLARHRPLVPASAGEVPHAAQ